ncbi:hypothetical protein MGG_15878 [Pyricularia oryzae 70-15]|uniref:Uncharacterized protein n=1 Tax=Pyricularia oryzae (strain 70-15 / ATCC MYA-4617 / FGSC 8958) TaxID=242507 RepID=G4MU07_PYRO7|nr:uncharacterized protein MGG_15878 [Pyricularia oryzae 70-15]EHA55607.1 hypothetical protein MGG_15878 [Pyricularia oryzae 70-15]
MTKILGSALLSSVSLMERGTCVRLGTRGRAILVKQCETAAAGAPGCPCPGVSGLWLVDRVSLRASSIAASLCAVGAVKTVGDLGLAIWWHVSPVICGITADLFSWVQNRQDYGFTALIGLPPERHKTEVQHIPLHYAVLWSNTTKRRMHVYEHDDAACRRTLGSLASVAEDVREALYSKD